MESLREQFEQAEKQVGAVQEKLQRREFIAREDLEDVIHLLVKIYDTRSRCVEILESEGLDTSGCRNLESLEKAMEINRRRRELEERSRRIRETLEGFFSIIPVDGVHQEALEGFQEELRSCGEEALIEMDQNGELELYRTFTDCVRSGNPDRGQVDSLKDRFGFQMVYAILAGQLQYVGPAEAEEEPEPAAAPGMPAEADGAPEEPVPPVEEQPETPEEEAEQPGPEPAQEPAAEVSGKEPVEAEAEPEEMPEDVPEEEEEDPDHPRVMVSSSYQLPDPGDLPYWEAWRDATTKVTFQEFRDKVRNLPKARILLPAFTRLGVLDAELMVRYCAIMNWDIPWHSDGNVWHDNEDMEEQVERSLWTLTKHAMVAEYRIEGVPKPLYCLTEYTNWCLHHEDIQQVARELFHIHLSDGNVFCIDMGNNTVVARQEMDRDRLLTIRRRNSDMADYLSFMNRAFEEQELNRDEMLAILNSFTLRNGRYVVLVPGEEKLYLCTTFHSLEEYHGTGGALLLTEERPEGPFSSKGPVFHYSADTLSCWLGKWYTMIHLVEPQPEPETEPEEEPWPSPEMEERVRQEEAMMTDDVIGPVEELAPENEMAQEDEEPEAVGEESGETEESEGPEVPEEHVPEEENPEEGNILPEEENPEENILPEEGSEATEATEEAEDSEVSETPEAEEEVPGAGTEAADGEPSEATKKPAGPAAPETSALFQVEETVQVDEEETEESAEADAEENAEAEPEDSPLL